MTTPASHLAILLVLLAIAACSDLALRRVPNWVSVAIAAAWFVVQGLSSGVTGALAALAIGAALGFGLSVPWRLGLMGGGDVKLAAAVVVWLGPSRAVPFLLATALAGAALGLPYLGNALLRGRAGVAAGTERTVVLGALRGASGRRHVPFGVAITIGAIVALVRGTP